MSTEAEGGDEEMREEEVVEAAAEREGERRRRPHGEESIWMRERGKRGGQPTLCMWHRGGTISGHSEGGGEDLREERRKCAGWEALRWCHGGGEVTVGASEEIGGGSVARRCRFVGAAGRAGWIENLLDERLLR